MKSVLLKFFVLLLLNAVSKTVTAESSEKLEELVRDLHLRLNAISLESNEQIEQLITEQQALRQSMDQLSWIVGRVEESIKVLEINQAYFVGNLSHVTSQSDFIMVNQQFCANHDALRDLYFEMIPKCQGPPLPPVNTESPPPNSTLPSSTEQSTDTTTSFPQTTPIGSTSTTSETTSTTPNLIPTSTTQTPTTTDTTLNPTTTSTTSIPSTSTTLEPTSTTPTVQPTTTCKPKTSSTTPKPNHALDSSCKNATTSGVHTITLKSGATLEALCQMDRHGGGWLVFQSRMDGTVNFNRSWSDYRNGFGDARGEYWLGLESLVQLTLQDSELLIEMEDFEGNATFARYNYIKVEDETQAYRLRLGSIYTGTAGDAMGRYFDEAFSTVDLRRGSFPECAEMLASGFWHYDCGNSIYRNNLNGIYGHGKGQQGIWWGTFNGAVNQNRSPLKTVRMMIRELQYL